MRARQPLLLYRLPFFVRAACYMRPEAIDEAKEWIERAEPAVEDAEQGLRDATHLVAFVRGRLNL